MTPDAIALRAEVDRLTRELAQAKANESVAISYAGECKADLVRSKAARLREQVKAAVDRARTTASPDLPREIEKRLLKDLYAALREAKS